MGLFDDLKGSKGGSVASDNQGARAARGGSGSVDLVKGSAGPLDSNIKADGSDFIKDNRKKKSDTESSRAGVSADVRRYLKGSSAGEVVTGGGLSADLLPVSVDDIPRLLPVWVGEWCANNDIQDVRKMSPLVFRALCAYIGNYIKESRILKDDRLRVGAGMGRSTCNAYDPARVAGLFSCFTSFCDACDKVPFSSSFAAFCGVSLSYVREYGDKLTSVGLDIRKKTHDAEMDSIRQKTSADPVGRLAILNNEYYTNSGAVASDTSGGSASLPASGAFGLIECRKLD